MTPCWFSGALLKYVSLQMPGWLLAVALAWVFVRSFEAPLWAAVLLVGVWMAKDIVLFPHMRRLSESLLGEPRVVGDTGVAMTDLAPRGFVRVHGELWQAESRSGDDIPEGTGVAVCDIRGFLLVVDALPEPYRTRVGHSLAGPGRRSEPARHRSTDNGAA